MATYSLTPNTDSQPLFMIDIGENNTSNRGRITVTWEENEINRYLKLLKNGSTDESKVEESEKMMRCIKLFYERVSKRENGKLKRPWIMKKVAEIIKERNPELHDFLIKD